MAGGFLIICGCTHVVAADTATFSLPEVKRGLFPFQVMYSMLQIMPPRQVPLASSVAHSARWLSLG